MCDPPSEGVTENGTTNEPDYDHLVHECFGVLNAGGNSRPNLVQKSQGVGEPALFPAVDGNCGLRVL